jgi:hypothetical protein
VGGDNNRSNNSTKEWVCLGIICIWILSLVVVVVHWHVCLFGPHSVVDVRIVVTWVLLDERATRAMEEGGGKRARGLERSKVFLVLLCLFY